MVEPFSTPVASRVVLTGGLRKLQGWTPIRQIFELETIFAQPSLVTMTGAHSPQLGASHPQPPEIPMTPSNRRAFLSDVGRGMLVAGLGASLVNDLGLSTAFAEQDSDSISSR